MTRASSEKRKLHNKKYYEANKQKVRERNNINRQKAYDYVNKVKASPCTDCGGVFDPVCMDFDHLPGYEKTMNIAKMTNGGFSIKRIQEEISKCELVCANCHRLRSKERQAAQVLR